MAGREKSEVGRVRGGTEKERGGMGGRRGGGLSLHVRVQVLCEQGSEVGPCPTWGGEERSTAGVRSAHTAARGGAQCRVRWRRECGDSEREKTEHCVDKPPVQHSHTPGLRTATHAPHLEERRGRAAGAGKGEGDRLGFTGKAPRAPARTWRRGAGRPTPLVGSAAARARSERIFGTKAEPQRIVVTRPLCRVQHPVPHSSRLQGIHRVGPVTCDRVRLRPKLGVLAAERPTR